MRRDRDRVGAERERGGGDVGVEAEVARPGLVADQRDAARVRDLGDARDVRDDAQPRRLDEQDRGARPARPRARPRCPPPGGPARRRAPRRPRARSTPAARPERTRPAATDLCEQRETITGVPSDATARQSAWLGCVEPLPEKRHRSAPKAVAASPSARARNRMPPRRSSAPPCIGASLASSGSPPVSAGLRLWPGVENDVGASRRNASTASAKGVSGVRHSRDAMRTVRSVQQQMTARSEAPSRVDSGTFGAAPNVPFVNRGQPVPQSGALSHAPSVTSGCGSLPSAFMTKTSARPPAAAVLKMIWLPSGE